MSIKGQYFDGRSSTSHEADINISDDGYVSISPAMFPSVSIKEVEIKSRIANIPRVLVFPDGGIFETHDHDALEQYLRRLNRHSDWLYQLESKASYTLAAFLFLALFSIASVIWGIPWLSNKIADVLPADINIYISEGAVESMDKVLFEESRLSIERQEELRQKFQTLLPEDRQGLNYRLLFRQSEAIGANAFALPDGTIIVTDDLVDMAYQNEEIISVLLHEIGHVVHKHSLNQILNHTGLAMLSTVFLGDVSAAGTLVLGLPNVLLDSSYSRDHEWQADTYALIEMQKRNIPTDHFSNFMSRMELEVIAEEDEASGDLFGYFSSHPPTMDRIARFQTEAGQTASLIDKPEAISKTISEDHAPIDLELLSLRRLLEQKQFTELDTVLQDYQQQYEQGQGSEITVSTAYELLATITPDKEALLDKWIENGPTSYSAYLVRGIYLNNMAWLNRGAKFKSETSDEQFDAMEQYQERAKEDLTKVLEINPRIPNTYTELISIAASQGKDEQKWQYFDDALAVDPDTYIVRKSMLYYLLPRWGGSYNEISHVVADSKEHIENNFALSNLKGYEYYAKSWRTYSNKEFETTIRLLTAAIRQGSYYIYYDKRADAYYSMDDFESAVTDYSNAIDLYPYATTSYYWRASAYSKLDKLELARQDLEYALSIEPYHRRSLRLLAWVLAEGQEYEESIKTYKKALYYHPNDASTLYFIGYALSRNLKDYKEAEEYLSRATELEPENAKYWYDYAIVLNELRDCDVIDAFNKYDQLCKTEDMNGCFKEGVKWANEMTSFLEESYCK